MPGSSLTPVTDTLTQVVDTNIINRLTYSTSTNLVVVDTSDTWAQDRNFSAVGWSYDQSVSSAGLANILRSYFRFLMPMPNSSETMYVTSASFKIHSDIDLMTTGISGSTLLRYPVGNGTSLTSSVGKKVNLHYYQPTKTWTADTQGSNRALYTYFAGTSQGSSKSSYGMSDFEATHFGQITLVSAGTTSAYEYTVDLMPVLRAIAPSNVVTPLGAGLGAANSGSLSIAIAMKMETESGNSSSHYAYFGAAPTIVYTHYENAAPDQPTPTTPINDTVVSAGVDIPFSATFQDQTGDTPTKFDLQISESNTFFSTIVSSEFIDTVDPLNCTVPLSLFPPNGKYYWRIRSYDANNAVSPWSDTVSFLTPSVTGWSPAASAPTATTSPRNKYRLEFYAMRPDLAGFDPSPSAIIFDAKSIGINHVVNAPGEFFFTIKSDHLQIGNVIPQKTLWRACRWDERTNYYRVIGEGIVTNSVITPHEVIFYGTDKIGMLNRIVVSADRIASGNSNTGTIAEIHDQITRNVTRTSSITASSESSGSVTLTGTNSYAKGDSVYIKSIVSGTVSLTTTATATVTSASGSNFTVPAFMPTKAISAAARNSPASGQVTYTTSTDHGYTTGMKVSVRGISISGYNVSDLSITVLTPTTFWVTASPTSGTPVVTDATVFPNVTTATASLLNRVTDMGWGAAPTSFFRDYSIQNSSYETATTSKQVQIAGNRAAEALAAVADILMAGTTNKVIIENPNIGQPAVKIDTMSVGLRYRHLKITDVVKPAWWFQYGVNIKNFTVEDNLDQMATKAIVINRNLDQSSSSLYNNGTTDTELYEQYGLVETVEIINEERNDIEFSKQLQYNLHPDRLFSIESDMIPNTISPFANYAVGDDITVYIVHNRADIKKDLTIIGQRWIGNSNGAEYLVLSFAPRITKSFIIPESMRARRPWSGRGRNPDAQEDTSPGSAIPYDPTNPDLLGDSDELPPWMTGGGSGGGDVPPEYSDWYDQWYG